MNLLKSGNLGYPRIGANREWKKALEAFWSGKLDESEFVNRLERIRLDHLRLQQQKGIDWIPVNDFSFYDHMLDTAVMFGLVPSRFGYEGGPVPLSTYYAMARGTRDAAACELTKWFNTNYHYIVPELNDASPALVENRPLLAYREAKAKLGIDGKPVLVGPYTFLKLSKGYGADQTDAWIERLLPLYAQVLRELEREGVKWVQIDEPILVTSLSAGEIHQVREIYMALNKAAPGLNMMLQTYFEAVDFYEEIVSLPVQGIGLDFVYGLEQNLQSLASYGFPEDKVLGAGLIDGRGIWRADLRAKIALLEKISAKVSYDRLIVQPSCSLLHVPVTAAAETELDPALRDALAFANEKLDELVLIARSVNEGIESVTSELEAGRKALELLNALPGRNLQHIREAVAQIRLQPQERTLGFAERRIRQQQRWNLPPLPTTTIGSFPQTREVRQARLKWKKGEWSDEQYKAFIKEQIATWIRLQEEIGLDVMVHGEFERTDMVEYFAEQLGGFVSTRNGWVQSYGSRCVKPPIIYGDVEFIRPMTLSETVYAQSLTERPVKGMLTGPLTMLNWSFVRDDLPREQVAYQIALALRREVEELEKAGIEMIQVDEPALRERLPLKKERWKSYLEWAVRAFRLTTSTVRDTTQIHTHMCYSEFHDIFDAINEMDADVISIETSRSHGELILHFEANTYNKGIGLGVYDIHSPRVPPVEEMADLIERALRVLPPSLFWINPDCGLKTRTCEETIASLRNMVQATLKIRERIAAKQK